MTRDYKDNNITEELRQVFNPKTHRVKEGQYKIENSDGKDFKISYANGSLEISSSGGLELDGQKLPSVENYTRYDVALGKLFAPDYSGFDRNLAQKIYDGFKKLIG